MRPAHKSTLGALVIALATLSACGPNGLAFRADERVTITAPRDRAEVTLPLTLRWTAEDLDRRDFGVYIDRAPVPPGRPFRSSSIDSFRTSETSFVLMSLPPGGSGDMHRATIVLLDERGRRLGESAFEVTFEVRDA